MDYSIEESLHVYNISLADDGLQARPALNCVSPAEVLIIELIAIVITMTLVAMFVGQMAIAQAPVTNQANHQAIVQPNLTRVGHNPTASSAPVFPNSDFQKSGFPSCQPQEEARIFPIPLLRASSSFFIS